MEFFMAHESEVIEVVAEVATDRLASMVFSSEPAWRHCKKKITPKNILDVTIWKYFCGKMLFVVFSSL